jgi:hypothetical protein
VRTLIDAWACRSAAATESILADDFVFEGVIGIEGRSDVLLSIACDRCRSCAFSRSSRQTRRPPPSFEALDPVTNLRHRKGWLLEHRDGLVRRIVELDRHINHR